MRVVLACTAVCAAPLLCAGKLDQTRDAVRGSSSSSSSDSSGSSSGSDTHLDSDDDFDHEPHSYGTVAPSDRSNNGILDTLCLALPFLLPHCVPYWVFERAPYDGGPVATEGRYVRYPYADGARGHLYIRRPPVEEEAGEGESEPVPGPTPAFPEGSQGYALRMQAEYAYDLDGVHRPGGAWLFELAEYRLGFETAWTGYLEPLDNGALDSLTFGELNILLRFAQTEWAEFRVGVGARLMIDRDRVDAGANYTYAFDLFPIRPLTVSGSVDIGSLGRALVVHARGTVGVMLSRLEVFAGWDVKLIDPVLFHGPLAGIRMFY